MEADFLVVPGCQLTCCLPTDDDLLIRWRKLEQPFLALPPNHIQLTGWRDPFIYRTHASSYGGSGDVWCFAVSTADALDLSDAVPQSAPAPSACQFIIGCVKCLATSSACTLDAVGPYVSSWARSAVLVTCPWQVAALKVKAGDHYFARGWRHVALCLSLGMSGSLDGREWILQAP